MEKCQRLEEYAIFVSRVRQYTAENSDNPEGAITRAIDECIEEGILKDILIDQKAEVLELVLTTFNRELYEQGLKDEAARPAYQKGKEEGLSAGQDKMGRLVLKLLNEGLEDIAKLVAVDENARQEYYKKYGIE